MTLYSILIVLILHIVLHVVSGSTEPTYQPSFEPTTEPTLEPTLVSIMNGNEVVATSSSPIYVSKSKNPSTEDESFLLTNETVFVIIVIACLGIVSILCFVLCMIVRAKRRSKQPPRMTSASLQYGVQSNSVYQIDAIDKFIGKQVARIETDEVEKYINLKKFQESVIERKDTPNAIADDEDGDDDKNKNQEIFLQHMPSNGAREGVNDSFDPSTAALNNGINNLVEIDINIAMPP
eukprot:405618_1